MERFLNKLFRLKTKKKEFLVNESDKFLFIHIPKNAGTSIASGLGFEVTSHIKAFEIKKRYGADYLNKRFSFSIIRNPIDRFISLYNYSRMEISYYHNNLNPSKSFYGKHLDYEILKNASLFECALLLKQGKLKHDNSWNHWQPQYTWLFDELGNIKLVDKIYRIDNLIELEEDLFNLHNYKVNFKTLNKSNNYVDRNLISPKTLEILFEYYKKDFELLNFSI